MKPRQNIENFTISFRVFYSFVNTSMPSVTMCGTKSRHNGSENTLVCVSLSAWRVVRNPRTGVAVNKQSPEGEGGGRQNYLDSSKETPPYPSLLTPATMQARIGTFHSGICKFFLFFPTFVPETYFCSLGLGVRACKPHGWRKTKETKQSTQ